MDNLTHSLVGALIGQAGLKRKTGLAMPALIIGANLPDIDGACVLLGDMQHLALRRGITHGPIAWVLLPLVLAAILWGFDRWQVKRGKRPEGRLPVSFKWLYLLSLIGCLSHPLLDWMNSYGIRFLEPFSSRWFYGDVLFIIDIWLWIGLGFATWLSLRREKRGGDWKKPARIALGALLFYVSYNATSSFLLKQQASAAGATLIPNPVPLAFWDRQLIWGYGDGLWSIGDRTFGEVPLSQCDLDTARRGDREVDAFLFWARAPYIEIADSGALVLSDARFASRGIGRFAVNLPEGTCDGGGGTE